MYVRVCVVHNGEHAAWLDFSDADVFLDWAAAVCCVVLASQQLQLVMMMLILWSLNREKRSTQFKHTMERIHCWTVWDSFGVKSSKSCEQMREEESGKMNLHRML